MSLRTQLMLLTALSVAIAVVAVSLAAYFAARDRLRGQIDQALHNRALAVEDARGLPRPQGGELEGGPRARDPFGQNDTFFQVINTSGSVVAAPSNQQGTIPINADDVAVANGAHPSYMRDVTSGDVHLRVITSPGQPGEAVQIARSLSEVDASLADLRNILFAVSGGGVLLAAIVGLIVAQRSLRPVAKLTAAAEHVAETQNLEARIEVSRNDEIGRLATSFNEMLQALHESRLQQRQLVTDASHELRTPLTSLRTNIEVLARGGGDMSDAERRVLLRDVTFELEELTKVVTELVELASDARTEAQEHEDVRLDQLAASIVERFARRSGLNIELDAQPTLVVGNYGLLERAAGNLVDNACKWSPPGGTVEVTVAKGVLSVRDHGPGIADVDKPHVFDRFYRAEAARAKPGSGLGLAIVKQIVEAHDGTVTIEPATDGGTIASIALAPIPMDAAEPDAPAPPVADAPGVGAAPGGAT